MSLVPKISSRPSFLRRLATPLLALAAAFLLVACTGNDDAPATIDFSGGWNATVTITSGANEGASFTLVITLAQAGEVIDGTWVNPAGTDGTMTGTVEGNVMVFTANQLNPCPASFQGTANWTLENVLEGRYWGHGCDGSPFTADFTATR